MVSRSCSTCGTRHDAHVITNQDGKTVLHIALEKEDTKIVQLLLERTQIDPNKKSGINGDSPLHTAVRSRNLRKVQLLLKRISIDPTAVNKFNQTPVDVFKARNENLEEDNETKRAIQNVFKIHRLGLPAEIKAFDKESAKVFAHLLEVESYPHFESRVMLAGEQGTGKTTIARYLIGKGPTRIRKSTDGIGLYTGLSYIDRETDDWLDGKQDFSLAELTISKSLKQKPLCLPTSRPVSDGNDRFSKPQEVNKDNYIIQDVLVEKGNDNTKSTEGREDFNKPAHSISDRIHSTNVSLRLDEKQHDSNESIRQMKDFYGADKMRMNHSVKIPAQTEDLKQQTQHSHSQDEKSVSSVLDYLDKIKCEPIDGKLVTNVLVDVEDKQQGNYTILPQNEFLDLNKQQDNPQEQQCVPKVLLDTDKHQARPPDKISISNVEFVLDTPARKFQREPFYCSEDNLVCRPLPNINFTKGTQNKIVQGDILYVTDLHSQHRDHHNKRLQKSDHYQLNSSHVDSTFDDGIPVHHTNAAIEDKEQEYMSNLGSSLVLGDTKHISFTKDLSMQASHVQEQVQTLTKSSEGEQATSGLIHYVESVTNRGVIKRLKKFFLVSKDVKEIKVSITEKHILKQSLKVGKKKLHYRHIAPVIIWDFGGQDVFYSTHQSFLSYRAIYLIVLNGSRTLDDPCQFDQYLPGKSGHKTARDYLRFWINTIVTYCKGSQHGFPRIMIVFTHKDKVKHSEVETTREQLFGDIKSMFQGSPLMSHLVIEDKIFVNARNKNDPEMAHIRTSIIRESKLQPTWGQQLPKCFIPLELEFDNLIRKDINVITFDYLKRINSQHPIRPLTDAELKVFLKFQHAIGKILYFDEPGLDQHVILLPTYLIDAFKSIITDKRFCKGEKQREKLWDLMSQNGVISKCAITELWQNRKYRRFKQHKDYLIAVMTHLDILVEPKRYDLKHNRIPTDFYFVASMVQAKDDTGYLQSQFFIDRNIAISFKSNSAIIPPALSFRFITYCLSIFDVKKYGKRNDNMLFHRSAVLTIDPSLDIHILCEDERIVVRLVHARKKVLILKDLASSICECLKSALQNISQLYIKTSSDNSDVSVSTFEMNLCCSVAEDPCLLSIEEFNKIESIWICPGHQLDHDKFVLSSWITEKETMMKCENACPVTNEEFLSEDLSALHLRRLSILYSVNEIRQLVGYLNLPYTDWDDLFTSETEPQLLKFKALCICHEQSTLTFRNIKNAVEEGQIQNPHTLCKVMRSSSVDFDTDPEKWDMVPSDEDIDKMATLIGNKSLFLLVELGMDLKIWDKINYSQMKRDLVKLNKDILDEWRVNFCKANNVRPTMRMIAHAYKSIGKDVRVIETTLFN